MRTAIILLCLASSAFAVTTATFNQAGTWETGGNWDTGQVPEVGNAVVIGANCSVTTDYSATPFVTLTVNSARTLTVSTGAKLYCTNGGSGTVLIASGGTLTMDGGTIRVTGTATDVRIAMQLATVTGSANGGTLQLYLTGGTGSVRPQCNITGNAASPLVIDLMPTGASVRGEFYTSEAGLTHTNVVFQNGSDMRMADANTLKSCTIHDMGTYGIYAQYGPARIVIDSCDIHSSVIGLRLGDSVDALIVNTTFGSTANSTADISWAASTSGSVRTYNCLFGSSTEVVGNTLTDMISTRHDQTTGQFKAWFGPGHTAETETSVVNTAGSAIKIVTNAATGTTALNRCRYTLVGYPAAQGDTLDVTIYAATSAVASKDTIIIDVDPDSIYGPTKSKSVLLTGGAKTYEKITVDKYTVTAGTSLKICIPIVVRCQEVSKTLYVDDLAVSLNGGTATKITLDYAPYDGVFPPIEAAGGTGSGIYRIRPRIHGD